MKISSILKKLRHSIRNYYVFYADSTELLEKAQEKLRPLPEGLRMVKLTYENKHLYKCRIGDLDKILQCSVNGELWGVVDDDNNISKVAHYEKHGQLITHNS